jgi:hypothetical protein
VRHILAPLDLSMAAGSPYSGNDPPSAVLTRIA